VDLVEEVRVGIAALPRDLHESRGRPLESPRLPWRAPRLGLAAAFLIGLRVEVVVVPERRLVADD